jgi:hypothetical protein
MSEFNFGRYTRELEFNGVIANPDERAAFSADLRTIYNLTVQYDNDYHDYDGAEEEDLFVNYASITPEILDDIAAGKKVDGEMISGEIDFMYDMLNAGDMDDAFGSQGWRYHLGWE